MNRREFLLEAGLLTFGSLFLESCQPERKVVGGVWGKLPDGKIIDPNIDIQVYAYPASNSDPAVSYVNVTGYWSNAWSILCRLEKPTKEETNEYDCNLNLDNLGVPPGKFTLSFDVYNIKGDKNLAPNGTKDFDYQPKR